MRLRPVLLLALLLTGCSAFHTTPQPPPAPTRQAQEITRAQSGNLPRLGSISVSVRGSPDDAQRALAAKADAQGATYYLIQLVDEIQLPGMWYATAILYGPSTAAAGTQQ